MNIIRTINGIRREIELSDHEKFELYNDLERESIIEEIADRINRNHVKFTWDMAERHALCNDKEFIDRFIALVYDEELRTSSMNQACEEVFGESIEDVIKWLRTQREPEDEDRRPYLSEILKHTPRKGQSRGSGNFYNMIQRLECVRRELDTAYDNKADAWDNLPDCLQDSDMGCAMASACTAMENALKYIDQALDELDKVMQ